jgi:hypothetical protein
VKVFCNEEQVTWLKLAQELADNVNRMTENIPTNSRTGKRRMFYGPLLVIAGDKLAPNMKFIELLFESRPEIWLNPFATSL